MTTTVDYPMPTAETTGGLRPEKCRDMKVYLRDHLDAVDTSIWIARLPNDCGTVACVAGHVSLQNGGVPIFPGRVHESDWDMASAVMVDGRRMWVQDHAMAVLGLTRDEAAEVFLCYDAEHAIAALDRVAARHGVTL